MRKSTENRRLRCPVSPETVRMLRLGHPWVIADRHTARWPKGSCGDVVALTDDAGTFLATALYDPESRIVARVLPACESDPDASWVLARLTAAATLRRWLDLEESDVWRLVNGEGDGLPGLTIDRYAGFLLVQYYTRAWERHLPAVVQAVEKTCSPKGVYAKYRPQQTRSAGKDIRGRHLAGSQVNGTLIVTENALRFRCDPVSELHTGLFLDQRANRKAFRQLAEGQRVLNLFAYTGAFSVAAAAGGAKQVTTVDAAPRYLEWAKENFSLNEIDPGAHEFIAGDCFVEMDRLHRARRRFDVILMDPPSFSTTRGSRFTTSGGTAELVHKALTLLEPGGVLVTSSNHQKVDLAEYLKELRRGALAAGRELRVIETAGQGGDFPYPVTFPEGRYLKYVVSVAE